MKFLSKLTLSVSVLGLSCGAFGMNGPEYSSGFKYEFGLNDAFLIGSAASAWQAITENTVPVVVENTVPVVTEVVADIAPVVVQEPGLLGSVGNIVSTVASSSLQWFSEKPERDVLYLGTGLLTLYLIYNKFLSGKPANKLANKENVLKKNSQAKAQSKKKKVVAKLAEEKTKQLKNRKSNTMFRKSRIVDPINNNNVVVDTEINAIIEAKLKDNVKVQNLIKDGYINKAAKRLDVSSKSLKAYLRLINEK